VPGETIMINAEIVNDSQTDIRRSRASLKQVCQLHDVSNVGLLWISVQCMVEM